MQTECKPQTCWSCREFLSSGCFLLLLLDLQRQAAPVPPHWCPLLFVIFWSAEMIIILPHASLWLPVHNAEPLFWSRSALGVLCNRPKQREKTAHPLQIEGYHYLKGDIFTLQLQEAALLSLLPATKSFQCLVFSDPLSFSLAKNILKTRLITSLGLSLDR